MTERVRDDRAAHSFPVWAQEENCNICGQPAAHKIEETSGLRNFHPLTAYLCCGCFEDIVGPAHQAHPYDEITAYKDRDGWHELPRKQEEIDSDSPPGPGPGGYYY